jgi:hypothetical protein
MNQPIAKTCVQAVEVLSAAEAARHTPYTPPPEIYRGVTTVLKISNECPASPDDDPVLMWTAAPLAMYGGEYFEFMTNYKRNTVTDSFFDDRVDEICLMRRLAGPSDMPDAAHPIHRFRRAVDAVYNHASSGPIYRQISDLLDEFRWAMENYESDNS